ncbi:ABC transporter permease [Mycoplasmatota bacterium]|nr:ABC transporter permease [Mycoplasmatota bacterium]
MIKNKITRRLRSRSLVRMYSALLAILTGLITGLVILIFTNPVQALPAFFTMLLSGFSRGTSSLGNVIYFATPIILTGLSVGFAFKTGLFNIGATGQMLMGAFIALFIGVRFTWLGPTQWFFALIAAGVFGSLWAILPGILKAFKGVHEVVSTIMMNYIALFFVNYLVKNSIYNNLKNESLPINGNAIIPKFGLDKIFVHSNIQGGFIIAIVCTFIIYFILNKTVFGFELKAVGLNKDASKYAGIDEKKSILYSMMIAGALAGLAGGVLFLTDAGKYLKVHDILPAEGFMGISVALLGLTEPIGIFLSGLFFGYLKVGGQDMQLYDFAPEVIDVITALIIYCSALSLVFEKLAVKVFKLREEGE